MQETQEMWVWSLGQNDTLEDRMETHTSILAWKIPWTKEPGGLQFMGLQRVRHDWSNWACMHETPIEYLGGEEINLFYMKPLRFPGKFDNRSTT